MEVLSFDNPAFRAYAVSAMLMVLKTVSMAWLTVYRMMQVKGGYRSPEDLRRTAINPDPRPGQTEPDERVERIRRIHQNDLENVPMFLVYGFLFLFTGPEPLVAGLLYYGYAASRFAHFAAYLTARSHDMRAALWTIGVLIVIWMSVRVLLAAAGFWPAV